jgi:hypothetical protein
VGACSADQRIAAAFLGGSHARDEADAYSDIDLCVVATDESYEDVRDGRIALIERLGEPLFVEDFGTDTVFFILADGTEGELSVGRAGALDEIEAGPHRTLFDRQGILDDISFPQEAVEPAAQDAALREAISWFWHELSHFIVAIGRDQPWWAAGQLEALRDHCVNLVRIEQGAPAGEEPYEKLDTMIRTTELSPLTATFVPMERQAMLGAALEIVRFFQKRAPHVAEAHEVDYPIELERLMVHRLDDLAASANAE